MNLKDKKYKGIRKEINQEYNKHNSWDDVLNLKTYEGMPSSFNKEYILGFIGARYDLALELNEELWEALIMDVKKEREINNPIIVGENIKSDVSIPTDEFSSWRVYIDSLERKGWPEKARLNIETSAFQILERLSQDTRGREANKGLVVGDVQSGKTANMAGLMAMAADHGYNFFIILSGVIENLRQQTSERLYKDLNGDGQSTIKWRQVDKPSVRSIVPEHQISTYNLKGTDAYFTVCLKNTTRLKDLGNWLFSDSKKAKQLKVLVIDDEADQASINTKDVEKEEVTRINGLIKDIVNSTEVRAMNYIAYTATPYANVLNDTKKYSLYPKDFITVLPLSNDYIGAKKLFGTMEPDKNPDLNMVRLISGCESKYIRKHLFTKHDFPENLTDSINWFLISLAIGRILKLDMPISMLVHSSMKVADHNNISQLIKDYLYHMHRNYDELAPSIEDLYEREKRKLSRDQFIKGMPGYSSKESIMNYPDWKEVKIELDKIFELERKNFVSHIEMCDEGKPVFDKGIHLVIDNSSPTSLFEEQENFRLVYPKDKEDLKRVPGFIVVGGNTLSRGLTLEGLSSTYFIRNTQQADTLMQMGRWFGYRKGYELLPRIWMDQVSQLRFTDIAQINEELKEEIQHFSEKGMLPSNYALRVKNSSNHKILRITSSNKMQSAISREFNFTGFNSQTIYFNTDVKELGENLDNTKEFLDGLHDDFQTKTSHMIWRGVKSQEVADYFTKFKFNEHDLKMRSIPQLVEWILKNTIQLDDWNIVLSGRRGIKENPDYYWSIKGKETVPVRRTQKVEQSSEEMISIGALRTPSDLLIDIEKDLKKDERSKAKAEDIINIRSKYGYKQTPLLVIYRIDSSYTSNSASSDEREPIKAEKDIIGLNILIPGDTIDSSFTTYISADIQFTDIDDNVTEEDE